MGCLEGLKSFACSKRKKKEKKRTGPKQHVPNLLGKGTNSKTRKFQDTFQCTRRWNYLRGVAEIDIYKRKNDRP